MNQPGCHSSSPPGSRCFHEMISPVAPVQAGTPDGWKGVVPCDVWEKVNFKSSSKMAITNGKGIRFIFRFGR